MQQLIGSRTTRAVPAGSLSISAPSRSPPWGAWMIGRNDEVATIAHARKFALQDRKPVRTQHAFVDDRHDFRPDGLQGNDRSIDAKVFQYQAILRQNDVFGRVMGKPPAPVIAGLARCCREESENSAARQAVVRGRTLCRQGPRAGKFLHPDRLCAAVVPRS